MLPRFFIKLGFKVDSTIVNDSLRKRMIDSIIDRVKGEFTETPEAKKEEAPITAATPPLSSLPSEDDPAS